MSVTTTFGKDSKGRIDFIKLSKNEKETVEVRYFYTGDAITIKIKGDKRFLPSIAEFIAIVDAKFIGRIDRIDEIVTIKNIERISKMGEPIQVNPYGFLLDEFDGELDDLLYRFKTNVTVVGGYARVASPNGVLAMRCHRPYGHLHYDRLTWGTAPQVGALESIGWPARDWPDNVVAIIDGVQFLFETRREYARTGIVIAAAAFNDFLNPHMYDLYWLRSGAALYIDGAVIAVSATNIPCTSLDPWIQNSDAFASTLTFDFWEWLPVSDRHLP